VVCIQAQTTTQKIANASISGKVTIKGKPAVGVVIIARDSRDGSSSMMRSHRARTDQTGSYRITNLSADTYAISTITPALVHSNQSDSVVVVADGEQVQDVNISLVPGGVITGKITDFEGESLIGQRVSISPVYEGIPSRSSSTLMARLFIDNITDDRGVYRAFGLPPGKYKVSVGESDLGRKSSREYFKETFYPSVTDAAKATVIEVMEGSVTNDVDIVMGRPVGTFTVTGRVVDENGKPIPNIKFGVGQTIQHDQNSRSFSSGSAGDVNANGEFRLENVTPGTYTIYTSPPHGSDVPTASVTFDVVDQDLDDLLIKTTKGGSLSGVIVLDGNERAPNMLSSLQIAASVKSTEAAYANSPTSAVGQDGTFRINGVRSGIAGLWLWSGSDKRKKFEIVRVERNGIPSDTINVKAGEHVTGLRVTVKYRNLTGAIRGQLKVENGELPPVSQLWLSLWPLADNLEPKRESSIPEPKLDARGRFVAEGLPAGTYQLTLYVYPTERTPGRTQTFSEKTQQVTVTDDTVTEVTLIIKPLLNPN
jgi:protocatechuate 3,4-dioxygenase beta subunit